MKSAEQIMPKFSEVVNLSSNYAMNEYSNNIYESICRYENFNSGKSLMLRGKKLAWLIGENSSLCDFINDLGEYSYDNCITLNLYDFYAAYNITFPHETVSLFNGSNCELDDILDMSELLSAILCGAEKKYTHKVILSPARVSVEYLENLRVKIIQQFIYLRMYVPVIISGSHKSARKRKLRLSVLGTKKAGKSAVINAMLGGEYSPSSSELPTPCKIIYSEDNISNRKIFLEHNGIIKFFSQPEDLKNFLFEKFMESRKNPDILQDDINVTVPEFPDIMHGFTIVDTPGSNFAGAKSHYDIACSEINEADIYLFVMNYSAHLTEDEIKIFDAAYKHKHTLIIALNRIDEMYSSEVVKSYERAADYIASRLNALGYYDFLIVPVSALTAVSAQRVSDDDYDIFTDSDKVNNTAISFAKNIIKSYKNFHGLKIKSPASLEETGRIKYLQQIIFSLSNINITAVK